MTKFALVSLTLPPSSSGQGVALYRLLRHLDPDSFCLISQRKYGVSSSRKSDNFCSDESSKVDAVPSKSIKLATDFLPVNYYHCSQLKQVKRGATWLARLRLLQALNFPIGKRTLPEYTEAIMAILKIEKCDAVVGCSGSLWDIPAAYEASKRLGLRFYAYYFDWWRYQYYWREEIKFAETTEKVILRDSAGVFVPNEVLSGELKARYGVEPVVLRNPCEKYSNCIYDSADDCERDSVSQTTIHKTNEQQNLQILYTGAIYGAQIDAINSLLRALDCITEYDIKLVVYTSIPHSLLKMKGIKGKVELHRHIHNIEVIAEQKRADFLFLPLSFVTHYNKEVISTAAPGKMSDYLASGRPVIVHAPADCFVSKFFIENDCGLVVTERNPTRLAEEIIKLIKTPETANRYVKNAKRLSELEFDSRVVSAKFYNEISK